LGLFPGATLTTLTAGLDLAGGQPLLEDRVSLIVVFSLTLLVTHVALSFRLGQADQLLLPTVGMLAALGVAGAERLAPDLAGRQTLWMAFGATALVGAAVLLPSAEWLSRYRYTWLAGGCLLIAATLVIGTDPNASGARLWLRLGDFSFQPSELLKIVGVVFFASYLAENHPLIRSGTRRFGPLSVPPPAYLGPLILVWSIAMLLLIWQRDLGAALLFYLVALAMLYLATGRSYLAAGVILLIVGGLLSYVMFDHVQLRTRAWLDPWPYAQGEAYQILQALVAYASGGVLGTGFGYGFPDYVPAVHTDFVLAALAEELGLLGALATVGLYVLLCHRCFRIALRARSEFSMLLAAGLGSVLSVQAIIIMAGNLRLMPITGVTLPFLSYGGSSMLASFAMIGLLLRISAESGGGPSRG
jgi:cell division protein FtsW (lipid II flippase)